MNRADWPEPRRLGTAMHATATGPALVAVLVVVATVLAVAIRPGWSGGVERIAISALGAIAVWWCARLVGHAYRPRPQPPRPGIREVGRLPQQPEDLDRVVSFSQSSALDAYSRLRPVLQPIVRDRLLDGRGIDLEREPERAREALGPQLFELVAPNRERPGHEEAGLTLRGIEEITELVEALGTDADR